MQAATGVFKSLFGGKKAPPPIGAIVKIHNPLPGMNEYLFEWHPTTGKVWVINTGKTIQKWGWLQPKHPAEIVAEFCEDEGRAFGCVQTWCRGFREGMLSVPHLLPPPNREAV